MSVWLRGGTLPVHYELYERDERDTKVMRNERNDAHEYQ